MISLCEVRILRDALVHNLAIFQGAQKIPVAPVLKSNAYGHGSVEVGKIMEAQNVPFVCVAAFSEAQALRDGGIRTPLLVVSYTPLENVRENTMLGISFGVVSLKELRRLSQAKIAVSIHLKFDTGFHRHGILPQEIDEAITLVASSPRLTLDGVYSHLADGDTESSELTRRQIMSWNEIAGAFRTKGLRVRYFHLSATTGVTHASDIDANVARFGVGLYGYNASLSLLDLKPALEMHTRISSIRKVPKGESVGYNGAYIAPSDRIAATVPVGYNEGIDRRLSGKGSMIVKGRSCPILGRVSMNITSLDVTDVEDVQLDDEVIAISANRDDANSIENIAKLCGTIPYEIMVHIPSELPRTVV